VTPLPLTVPDWLVDLAARDEPPTTIDDKLLSRLQWHGAVFFRAYDADRKELEDADAHRAAAIGVLIPGNPLVDSLEDELAPVRASLERLCAFVETFDRMRRLFFAASDMRDVAQAARQLASKREGDLVFEAGLVTTYARTYLGSGQTGGVTGHPMQLAADRP
jgi:hypothetical protein